jgi:hypothetical protein
MAKAEPKIEAEVERRPLFVVGKRFPAHILAAVKAWKRWDDLFQVSDEELAAAVKELESIRIG